jgi:hypothetical protein
MREVLRQQLGQSVADALETLAFVACAPLDGTPDLPDRAIVCRISFTGPHAGTVEAAMPLALAADIAATLTGGPPADNGAAEDCARELLNVTCGRLLRGLPAEALERTQMLLPQVDPCDAAAWAALAAAPSAALFDADGHPLIVALKAAA